MQTQIVPVSVFPSTANVLFLRAGNLGPPPTYYYQLQAVDADGNVTVLKDGNVNMTPEQWNQWPADLGEKGDSDYQLGCIAANLGLTRA